MKTALVLGGGGSKGSYEMGVWKALKELDIDIDMVFGSSIGSINGLMVAQDDYDKALDIWLNQSTSDLFGFELCESKNFSNLFKTVAGVPIEEFLSYASDVFDGGLNTANMRQVIESNLDEEKLRSSGIDYGLIMTNRSTFTKKYVYLKDMPVGKVSDYIIASSTFCPVDNPICIDGDFYIDGGFSDNLPVTMAGDSLAERVICVDLDAVGVIPHNRVKLVEELSKEFYYIKPKIDLGNMLYFNAESAKNNIELGYLDCMKAFGKLDGDKFAFKKETFAPKRQEYLGDLAIKAVEILADAFDFSPYVSYDKATFDKLIKDAVAPYIKSNSLNYMSVSTLVEHRLKISKKDRIARIALSLRDKEEEALYLSPAIQKVIGTDILAATYVFHNFLLEDKL